MCGIAGFIHHNADLANRQKRSELSSMLSMMGDSIVHRGPDQHDEWLSHDAQCGFAHRRLSIIDLSAAGQQPMTSGCGRYVMIYNGMVYNYKAIRQELSAENITFRGSSDTEVILEAIALWGFKKTLQKLHGMFAIAVYDNQTGTLQLARDRLGEKPLYIGCHDGQIVFASELKPFHAFFKQTALKEDSNVLKPELNRSAIGLYLHHGYIPAPYSVYENIFKLAPGTMLSITVDQIQFFVDNPLSLVDAFEQYWSLSASASSSQIVDQQQTFLSDVLHTVVKREMNADVPLGAFLSGGVDSSTIVAIMQQISKKEVKEPIRTFSIGFEKEAFNEAPFAAEVAKHLGTQHFEKIVTTADAQAVIPELAKIYDEPFADSSQIPTILVSQLAREQVTVSLSGDGGDELFGGYERYHWAHTIWQKIAWMPLPARKVIAAMIHMLMILNSTKSPKVVQNIAAKFERLASMLSAENRQFFYRVLISAGVEANQYVLGAKLTELSYTLNKEQLQDADFIHQMMYLDIHSYLPDDILTKVDRASMCVSLESRVPLLDHSIVELAWQMREQSSLSHLPAKQPLRKILYQYVPKTLIERPKKGFAVPLSDWLRGDLLSWAELLLDRDRLKQEAVFDADKVYQVWNDFKQGKEGAEHFIWSILMFQLWHEQWYSAL